MKRVAFAPALLLLITTGVVFFLSRDASGGSVTPTIAAAAAVIAVTSVSVTALTSYANWVRGKRQATLAAWSEWVDATQDDRKAISLVIGVNAGLTYDQGKAICNATPFMAGEKQVTEETSKELRRQVRQVLSGLERLAVGVEQMVYDRDVLMELGGTIVVTTYARLKTYIVYTQERPEEDKRRPFAYQALDALVTEVESEEGKARRQLFDASRLRRIRQTTGERA